MANKRDKIARRRQIAKTRKGKTRTTRSKPAPPPRDPEDAKKQRMIDLWIAVGIVIVAIVLFLVLRNVSSRTPDDSDITAETATPSASEEATLTMEENVMSWSQPPEMAIDLEKDYRANIKTAKGDMLIDLREDLAPVTVNNFVFLAREGFYDGVTFHRVMAGFMAQRKDAGICGPRLLYPDGRFQVSFYSFPTLSKTILRVFGLNKLLFKSAGFLRFMWKFKKIMPEYINMFNANYQDMEEPAKVPWVTGACLMIERNLFESAGYFDEKFVMYCEDMDLCSRAGRSGKSIYFVPGARVTHYRGWGGARSMESLNFYFDSHKYYYQKNFRGFYKNMLLCLNKFEWFYEKAFLSARIFFNRKKQGLRQG